MSKKRFTISKPIFLDWLIAEEDDLKYWGARFIKDLKEHNNVHMSTKKLFDSQETLPAYLFEEQITEIQLEPFDYMDGIPIEEIQLIQ